MGATSGWYRFKNQPEGWEPDPENAGVHNGCGGEMQWSQNDPSLADCNKCGGRFNWFADRDCFLFLYRAHDDYEPPAPKLVWVTRQDGTRHTSLVEVDGGLERVKLW